MIAEEWKPITGYEGRYEISNCGEIRSFCTDAQRILKPIRLPSGYLKVNLIAKNHHRSQRRIHQLVLETFVGQCPKNLVCCHNDGDKTNNHISNLRWDTISNNRKDTVIHGNMYCGEKHWSNKLKKEEVEEIKKLLKKNTKINTIAKIFKVSYGCVDGIDRKKNWKHLP